MLLLKLILAHASLNLYEIILVIKNHKEYYEDKRSIKYNITNFCFIIHNFEDTHYEISIIIYYKYA